MLSCTYDHQYFVLQPLEMHLGAPYLKPWINLSTLEDAVLETLSPPLRALPMTFQIHGLSHHQENYHPMLTENT